MNKQLNIVTLLLILSMFGISDETNECTFSKPSICAEPILRYLPSNSNTSYEKFTDACRKLPDVKRCTDDLGCLDFKAPFVIEWQGYRDAFDYLCSDDTARKVFFSNPCLKAAQLNNSTISAKAKECSDQSAKESRDNSTCFEFNSALKCSDEAVNGCDLQWSRVYISYLYYFLKPIATFSNCTLVKPDVMVSEPDVMVSVAAPLQTTYAPLMLIIFVYTLRM